MTDFVGVVVAAGSASRFGGAVPKQYRRVGERTVLEHSVRAIADVAGVDGVLVVLAGNDIEGDRGREVRGWPGVLATVAGGATRHQSVRRGVEGAPASRYLLIHDAARPLASSGLIQAVMAATREHGAAIPAVAVPDTVKRVGRDGVIVETVDRERLRLAQTPQGARTDWLRAAFESVADPGELTDEASLLEKAGRRVAVVPGDPRNRKVTTAEDLEEVRRMVEGGSTLRVGTGFDVHRFGPGRVLVLGGVTFPDEPGLVGHSDADVVLHAAMDALLGAAALGDIGAHFPPGDPAFAGADSKELARQVAALLDERGWRPVNLDLTVLAEKPKIRARVDEMRAVIAACFGVRPDRVGLKATTLEKLGALGRGEGIACEAVACIRGTDRGGE